MKRKHAFLLPLFLLAVHLLPAQDRGIGVGLILGEPTGIAARWWVGETTALDGAAAWSLARNRDSFSLHLDYVFHQFDVFDIPEGDLPIYLGPGLRVTAAAEPLLGLRVALGLAYLFEGLPLDLFVQVAPTLVLLPSTGFDLSGGFGLRWFF